MKEYEIVSRRVAKMTNAEMARLADKSGVSYGTINRIRWAKPDAALNLSMKTLGSLAKVLKEHRVIDVSEPSETERKQAEARKRRRANQPKES